MVQTSSVVILDVTGLRLLRFEPCLSSSYSEIGFCHGRDEVSDCELLSEKHPFVRMSQ